MSLNKVKILLEKGKITNLGEYLVASLVTEDFIESKRQTIALYPGKFKPPHKGHLEAVKLGLKNADKVIVIISPKALENYTDQKSKKIWDLFKKTLGSDAARVEIKISRDSTPIRTAYGVIKTDPTNNYIALFGKGEEKRWEELNDKEKYPNAEPFDLGSVESKNIKGQSEVISSTNLRKAIKSGDIDRIKTFLPHGVDVGQYLNIINSKDKEEVNERILSTDLDDIDDYADKKLSPLDIKFTDHFFDRVNDPRNGKEITDQELISFFDRLSKYKDKFIDFLNKYKEIVTSDKFTKINIPFVKTANSIIAKTIMRKPNFNTPDVKLVFEGIEELLNLEAKQVGVLYHFTKLDNLYHILKSDKLRGTQFPGGNYYISFTRDKNFNKSEKRRDQGITPEVKITVDGNKLSSRYKFEPYNYYGDPKSGNLNPIPHSKAHLKDKGEFEERIILKNELGIQNFDSYVISYEILLNELKKSNLDDEGNKLIIDKINNFNNPKVKVIGDLNESRQSKKLKVFDFDNTLAHVNAKIIVTHKDGKQTKLSTSQYAKYEPKKGDEFSFKEFNTTIKKAKPISSNIDKLKKSLDHPSIKTTILTARGLTYPVKKYLKDEFNIEPYIVGLGSSDPQHKAEWIEQQIKKGYNDIEFLDDSDKNIKAVDKLKEKYPDVNLKTQLIKESKYTNKLVNMANRKDPDRITSLGKEYLGEKPNPTLVKYIGKLVDYCCEDLKISKPEIILINSNTYTKENNSFGGYSPSEKKIYLSIKNRNLADCCRTLSHELKHHEQNLNGRLTMEAGKDGDIFENEANSYSGKVMRQFGRENPEIYNIVC